MYDEPSRVNSLRNHLVKDTSDRPTGIFTQSSEGNPEREETNSAVDSLVGCNPTFSASDMRVGRGTQYGQPRNLRDWPIDLLTKPASDLKCRCYQFQILSRGLILARSRQDHLHVVDPILSVTGIPGRLIGLNTLQGTSKRVLVLGGRTHCNATKTDNSHSNQHCRDQAYGDLGLELFHKLAQLQEM